MKTEEEINRQMDVLEDCRFAVEDMWMQMHKKTEEEINRLHKPGGRKVIVLAEQLIEAIDAHLKRVGKR